MDELISGLIGLTAGALLGGVMQLFVAARERRHSTRSAAALTCGDVYSARFALEMALDDGDWWPELAAPRLADWREQRGALVLALGGDRFVTVEGAFHQVMELEALRLVGSPWSEQTEALARAAQAQFDEVWAILIGVTHSKRAMFRAAKAYRERLAAG